MRDIHLHGALARFGGPYRFEIDTAGEAVRALSINVPGFVEALREGHYRLVRGDLQAGMDIGLEELNSFRLGTGELHILPVLAGAKSSGGMIKVVAGLALVGAAIFFAPAGLAGMGTALGGGLLSGVTYGTVAMVGLGLALVGVSSMLTAAEEKKEKDDSSHTLSGPGNNAEQGVPVPLVYGEVITGGPIISVALDIEDIGKAKSDSNKGVGSYF